MKLTINNIGSQRNLLNVHRTASDDKTLEVINHVRLHKPADTNKLYLSATDRYALAEAVLEVEASETGEFEAFIHRTDVARVLKEIKARTQTLTISEEADVLAFGVDGMVTMFAQKYMGGDFPPIARLWPDPDDLGQVTEEAAHTVALNSRYLDRFRLMEPSPNKFAPLSLLFGKDRTKPIVVQPLDETTWRGLLVPINGFNVENVRNRYATWQH